MDRKEQRNYLLDEIQKRIIGPGFTEETYVCANDASDEILINRSHIVYTSGILFPQISEEDLSDTYNDGDDSILNADDVDTDTDDTDTDDTDDTDTDDTDDNNADYMPNAEDANQFRPNHIGLVACLNIKAEKVDIELDYGQYKLVCQDDYAKEVRVRLGRCTIEQLKETFDYYDKYAKETLMSIGVNSVEEMFLIDEENNSVSPKKLFEIGVPQNDGSIKYRYLRTGDFPSLLQNKAASIVCKLLRKPSVSQSIKGIISWGDLREEIAKFDRIEEMKVLLQDNKLESLNDCFEYTEESMSVRVKKAEFKTNDMRIEDLLYVDDPVKDCILEKLLQFRFFKRYGTTRNITIDLSKKYEDVNDDVKLIWKVIPSRYNPSQQYLRILLVNKHKKAKKDESSVFIHQAKMRLVSPYIMSYTEQHRSAVDDGEYELNEVLYSDELVYAKGVNCAATWEQAEHPAWVQTTYMPQKHVRSFSTSSDREDVNEACRIYDMTIWSSVSKEDVLERFRKMASAYCAWQNEQKRKASSDMVVLSAVLQDQQEFYERLLQNIEYLANNDRAYRCFQLANSAMYIQMLVSRDPNFEKKARIPTDYDSNSHFYGRDAWDYFSGGENRSAIKPIYRPFQLAFLLMNVEATFEQGISARNEIVDLIWFPTGGGKTEAYLALAALTIAERRTSGCEGADGVSVIMRYTLRLLTAQQFERASFLICSLEYLRNELRNRKEFGVSLGEAPISIGMWIGKASTPNRCNDLGTGKYRAFFDTIRGNKDRQPEVPQVNPFPVSYCPWCGCNLVGKFSRNNMVVKGYDENTGSVRCINRNCQFNVRLPIYYIDEQLYENPPTLLFATVDKFAQLYNKRTGSLFGVGTGRRKPDLIIQDELHLISGPLGSIVGMFETMVEELCTERDANGNVTRRPKIIASTATTRNTRLLIKQLYNRDVKTFPVSGVRYDDNFFSHVVPLEECKRLYSGIAPTGHTAAELEVRTIAAELVAKEKMIRAYLTENNIDLLNRQKVRECLFNDSRLVEQLDNYWTLVIYYKDLRSLGKAHSRIGQEVFANAASMRNFMHTYPSLDFVLNDFPQRTNEFTGRQESSRIKQLLVEAYEPTKVESGRIVSKMDIVQATNMISVGIDIARWNVMLMIGQPMTTADYIQASSRVGRTHDGLIVNLLNPMRTRELSFYENYEPYHQALYKYVEPLSATTFTEMTLQKLLLNLYLCFMVLVRRKEKPEKIGACDLDAFKNLLEKRCRDIGTYKNFVSYMNSRVDSINDYFNDTSRINREFSALLSDEAVLDELHVKFGTLMSSLRDVESNSFVLYE